MAYAAAACKCDESEGIHDISCPLYKDRKSYTLKPKATEESCDEHCWGCRLCSKDETPEAKPKCSGCWVGCNDCTEEKSEVVEEENDSLCWGCHQREMKYFGKMDRIRYCRDCTKKFLAEFENDLETQCSTCGYEFQNTAEAIFMCTTECWSCGGCGEKPKSTKPAEIDNGW